MRSDALISLIPAGVFDTRIEFFSDGITPMAFFDGRILYYDEFPAWIKELVYNRLLHRPVLLQDLVTWGLTDKDDQIRRYLLCTRSVLDTRADVNEKGELQPEEYVPCSKRISCGGDCSYEGKICTTIITLDNGEQLTPRQVEVTRKIGEDRPDKQIISDLGITQSTFRTHKDMIRSKGNISSKSGIAILAHQYNLI